MQTFVAATSERAVAQMGVDVRARFITRTYTHLFGAIAAFIGLEVALFTSGLADRMAPAMLSGSWLLILGGFMLVSWIATHMAHSAKGLPAQYAALGLFVVGEALIFVPLLWMAQRFGPPGVLADAALVTLLGFLGLSIVVFTTRKDFSFLRPFLMFGGLLALGAIVVSTFTGFQLGTWYSVAMVVFASGAILWDTSNVLHHYPEDRYVGAALQLFASVALLFWYVLRLFMNRD